MSKKKKRTRWFQNKHEFSPGFPEKPCHEAKWVYITEDIKVFCGMPDRRTKNACLNELDVFFALCDYAYKDWKETSFVKQFGLLRKYFSADEFMKLSQLTKRNPQNIVDAHIEDGEIDLTTAYIIEQTVLKGAKVGFGCMGGHGRTGWLLGYLLHRIGGHPKGNDLILLVKDLLCKEAIETRSQVLNLGGDPSRFHLRFDYTSGYMYRLPGLERETIITEEDLIEPTGDFDRSNI